MRRPNVWMIGRKFGGEHREWGYPKRNPYLPEDNFQTTVSMSSRGRPVNVWRTFWLEINANGVKKGPLHVLCNAKLFGESTNGMGHQKSHETRHDLEMSEARGSSSSTMLHIKSPFKYYEARNPGELAFCCFGCAILCLHGRFQLRPLCANPSTTSVHACSWTTHASK